MNTMFDNISIITTTTPNPTNDSRPTPTGRTPTAQLNSGTSSSRISNNAGNCGVGDEEKEDEAVTTVTDAATATVTDAIKDTANDNAANDTAADAAAAVVPTTTTSTSTSMTCTHTKRRTMNMNAVNTLLYIRQQNNGGHPIHGDVQHVVKMYQCPDIVNRNSINYQLRLLSKQQQQQQKQQQQQESKNSTNNKKRKLHVTEVATLSSPTVGNNKKSNVQTVNLATLSPPTTNDKKKKHKAKIATVTAKVAASVPVPVSAATTITNQSPTKKLNTTSATHKKHGTRSLLNITVPIEVEVQRGLENIGTINNNNKDTVATVTKETTTRAMRRSLNVDAVKTLLQIRKQNGGPKHGDISDVVHMFHCPDIVNRNSINYQLQVLQNNGNISDGNDDNNDYDDVLVEGLALSTRKKKLKEKDTTDVAKLSSPIVNNVVTLPPSPTIIKNTKQKDKSAVTEIKVVTTTEGTNRTSNDKKQKSTSSIRTKRGISAVSNIIANDDEDVEALDTDTTDERKIHGQQRSARVCPVQNEVTTTTTTINNNNNKPNILVRRILMKSAMDILLKIRYKNNNRPKHGDVQKVIEMFNFPDVVNRNSINYQLHLLKTKNGNNNNDDGQYDVVPEPNE